MTKNRDGTIIIYIMTKNRDGTNGTEFFFFFIKVEKNDVKRCKTPFFE
jgi:hypothetical protein